MITYNTPDTLRVLAHHMNKFQNLPFSWFLTRSTSTADITKGLLHTFRYLELPQFRTFPEYYDRYLRRATPFLLGGLPSSTYAQTLDADAFRFFPGYVVLFPCAVFLPKPSEEKASKRWRLRQGYTWIWFNYEVSQLLLPYREVIREKDWTSLKPIAVSTLLQASDYFFVARTQDWDTEVKAHPRLDFYAWYEKGRTVSKADLEKIKGGGNVYDILKACESCLRKKENCVCARKARGKKIEFEYPDDLVEIR